MLIFGIHRDHIEADRARELRARNEELEALRQTLEEKVEQRTLALRQRNADMRLVLDNVAQGVFTVNRSGGLSSEYSATLAKWFGAPEPNHSLGQYFVRVSHEFANTLISAGNKSPISCCRSKWRWTSYRKPSAFRVDTTASHTNRSKGTKLGAF